MKASKNLQGSKTLRGQSAEIPQERETQRGEPDPWRHFPFLPAASEAGEKNWSSGPVKEEGPWETPPVFNWKLFWATPRSRSRQKPGFDSAPSLTGLVDLHTA